MMSLQEAESTCGETNMTAEKFDLMENPPQKTASSAKSANTITVLFIVTLVTIVLLTLAVVGLGAAFSHELAELKSEMASIARVQSQSNASFFSLDSQLVIEGGQNELLNFTQKRTEQEFLRLHQKIATLEEKFGNDLNELQQLSLKNLSSSIDEIYLQIQNRIASIQNVSAARFDSVAIELQSLSSSVDKNHQLLNETAESLQHTSAVRHGGVSSVLENLTSSVEEQYQQIDQKVSLLEHNSKTRLDSVSVEVENLTLSVEQKHHLVNEMVASLQHTSAMRLDSVSAKLNNLTLSVEQKHLQLDNLTLSVEQKHLLVNEMVASLQHTSTMRLDSFSAQLDNFTLSVGLKLNETNASLQHALAMRLGTELENLTSTVDEKLKNTSAELESLTSSVYERYSQANEKITSLESVITGLENFTFSIDTKYLQITQNVAYMQQVSSWRIGNVSAEMENLASSLSQKYQQVNQLISSIQLDFSLRFEDVLTKLASLNISLANQITFFNSSVKDIFQEINSTIKESSDQNLEMIAAKLEEESIVVDEKIFRLNSSVQEHFESLHEMITVFEGNYTMKLASLIKDQNKNFDAVAEIMDSFNSSFRENYELLSRKIANTEENTEEKFSDISDELDKNFTAVVNLLNSTLDRLFEKLNFSDRLVSKKIERIHDVLLDHESTAEVLNASLSSKYSQLDLVIAALQDEMEERLQNMSAEQDSLVDEIATLNSSLYEIYLELDGAISHFDENSSAHRDQIIDSVAHAITGLETSVNDLHQKVVDAGNTVEKLNATFIHSSTESEAIFGEQYKEIQRLNISIDQLSQAIVSLEETSTENFTSSSMEQERGIQSLNFSLYELFSRLEQLNAASIQQLNDEITGIQTVLADQESGTQALNSSLTSQSLHISDMVTKLYETIGAKIENFSAEQAHNYNALMEEIVFVNSSLNDVYLELGETINGLLLENSTSNQEQIINSALKGLEASVSNLSHKIVLTTSRLNSSFTEQLGSQVDMLQFALLQQAKDGQRLNSTVNEKYSELSQAVANLEEASLNITDISVEQDIGLRAVEDGLTDLNSSISLLIEGLAIDSRLNELNASFAHLLNQQIQDFLLRQLNTSQRLNATFTTSFSNISETIAELQTSISTIGLWPFYPASSCSSLTPSSPSGYYWIQDSTGSAVRVYCDMTRPCGNVTGGWVRIAHLDMTDSNQQCPSGLKVRNDSNRRTCIKNTDSDGCASVQYPTSNILHSRVCGKVIGYQVGTPKAFDQGGQTLSSTYLDGVSLTHGMSKHHIWSFAATPAERNADKLYSCHCMNPNAPSPPTFISSDYFCDTGLLNIYDNPNPGFLGDNPLWDGQGCGPTNDCCVFNTPPWFHKQLTPPASDDIEMRICRKEHASVQDTAIESVEIYIQ